MLDVLVDQSAGASFGGVLRTCSLREVLLPISFWYHGFLIDLVPLLRTYSSYYSTELYLITG